MNIYRIPVRLVEVPGFFGSTTKPHYDQRYNKRNWLKTTSRYFPHQSAREKARRLRQLENHNV